MSRKASIFVKAAAAGAVLLTAMPAQAASLVIWYDMYWNQVGYTIQRDDNFICESVGTYGPNYQYFYLGPDGGECPDL